MSLRSFFLPAILPLVEECFLWRISSLSVKVRPNVSVRAADDYNGHRQWSDDGRTPFSLQSVELYIRTPTKCKVLYTQPTSKSKVCATVSSKTTCVLNTKTIQSTVSHAKCILFLPPLPGGPKPTQCNILLATALTKINGGLGALIMYFSRF